MKKRLAKLGYDLRETCAGWLITGDKVRMSSPWWDHIRTFAQELKKRKTK